MRITMTKAQKLLFDSIIESFADFPLNTTSCIEAADSEKRSALALERKGLIRFDGDIYLTDDGVNFARRRS